MSRSSQDVFADIEVHARLAKEDSAKGMLYLAQAQLEVIECYLSEAKKRLKYDIKCKQEADRQTVNIRR